MGDTIFFLAQGKLISHWFFKATYSHHIHGQCINSVVVLVDQKPSLSIILLLLERTSLEKFLRTMMQYEENMAANVKQTNFRSFEKQNILHRI